MAQLLGKLLIEQTRSRPHRSGDNGLVEAKNGAIIRKHIGYGYISPQHAQAMDQFYREHLNPYVNFHRPCAVPEVLTQANGKRRRIYSRWATPFELLRESPHGDSCLRPAITFAELERFATLRQLSILHRSGAGPAAGQAQTAQPGEGRTDRLRQYAIAPPAGRRSAVHPDPEKPKTALRWKTQSRVAGSRCLLPCLA